MPRQPRHFLPNIPLHLIQRGNNRQPCFISNRDYSVYIATLEKYSRQFEVAIHSFVLMTNHVHLLATPVSDTGPSQLFQALGRRYVRYFNDIYGRTGTLWEGRFKACLVDSATYFLTVSRYIELNPVRAGMVEHPADYLWSSYHANALGKPAKLLTPHGIYLNLGDSRKSRLDKYQGFFDHDISEAQLEQIRHAAASGLVLGNCHFKRSVEAKLGYPLPPFKRGGDRRSAKQGKNNEK